MITSKPKICKDCGELKLIFSKGLCEYCLKKGVSISVGKKPIKGETLPLLSKNKSIKVTRKTERSIAKGKERSEKREEYFNYHIKRCQYSEQSHSAIAEPTRANICHLIDKGRHPSLQADLSNYIYLTFSEHQRFDQLLFSLRFEDLALEFNRAWPIACSRIATLLPLCQENTIFIRKIKEYLTTRSE